MTPLKIAVLTLIFFGALGAMNARAAMPLDDQITRELRVYLERRPRNPAAKRTLTFLDAHPEIRAAVEWTPEDGEAWAEWKQDKMEIALSSEPFVSLGLSSSSRTLSADQLKGYLSRYAAIMVHELSHARSRSALVFSPSGTLDDEVLAWQEQASFQKSEGLLSDPAAARSARIWAEELVPATEKLDALADRAIAASEIGTAESKLEHKRLYALHQRMKAAHAEIEARVEKELPGKDMFERQMLGVTAAFERGCSALRAMVKVFHPDKRSLLASDEERARDLADQRSREKMMTETCPQLEDPAKRAECESTLEGIRRGIAFWSDPAKVAAARREYESRSAIVCAD